MVFRDTTNSVVDNICSKRLEIELEILKHFYICKWGDHTNQTCKKTRVDRKMRMGGKKKKKKLRYAIEGFT